MEIIFELIIHRGWKWKHIIISSNPKWFTFGIYFSIVDVGCWMLNETEWKIWREIEKVKSELNVELSCGQAVLCSALLCWLAYLIFSYFRKLLRAHINKWQMSTLVLMHDILAQNVRATIYVCTHTIPLKSISNAYFPVFRFYSRFSSLSPLHISWNPWIKWWDEVRLKFWSMLTNQFKLFTFSFSLFIFNHYFISI